mmetsp:Transcript_41378/g.98101  ORF Transcript_41378/g.98101 Transcript_41378/m.98101 type:complete len:330 (+) Transcript_41378:2761-3750(+)
MRETMQEMDQGLAALPKGAEVTLFNQHFPGRTSVETAPFGCPELDSIFENLRRISMSYLEGNPLNPKQLEDLPLQDFNSIIVLCDKAWMDPDLDPYNGIDARAPEDMLRMDSLVMMVQVHVRMLLERRNHRNVKIITEKVAFEGQTRFEDATRVPFGFYLNRKNFSAGLLAQVAYEPKYIPVLSSAAQATNAELRDPHNYVEPGEEITYWALAERVEESGELLLGFIELPESNAVELVVEFNPKASERMIRVAWGNRQLKLVTLSERQCEESEPTGRATSEMEMAMMFAMRTKQSKQTRKLQNEFGEQLSRQEPAPPVENNFQGNNKDL